MDNLDKQVVGLDLGMGATKLWSSSGGSTILSQVSVPSGREINLGALGLVTKRKPQVIANGTGRYLVGEGAHDVGTPVERLDYDRLTGAPEMRALVYGALSQADAVFVSDVHLVVGLPLGLAGGDNGRKRVAAVKAWLVGNHHKWPSPSTTPRRVAYGPHCASGPPRGHAGPWQTGGRDQAVHIVRNTPSRGCVGCVSQAHAAYTDWCIDLDGTALHKPDKSAEIAVISVGFNTIELLVLRDNQPLAKFTAGEKLGVRRLLEIANEQRGGLFTLGELDIQLRTGALRDVAAVAKWTSQVKGHIEREWGDAAQCFERVLAVGGGSLLLADALRELFGERLITSDEPVLSVARGLYKLGLVSTHWGVVQARKAAKTMQITTANVGVSV